MSEEAAEPDRVPIDKLHPDVYLALLAASKALRAATDTAGLDRRLVELVNLRVSQINGCAYCLDVHTRGALKAGETPQRIAVLPAWRDTELFSEWERGALALAESVTRLGDPRAQDLDYAYAAERLSPEELSAVSWLALLMNAFNRISIVSRHQVKPAEPPEEGTA